MDPLQTRLDALEHHMHTVNRRLRWWRGLACGLAVLGLLGWGLPLGLAREEAPDQEKGEKGLAQRVAALEQLLKHVSREKNEIFITGANLHLVNGLGSTDCFDEQNQEIPDCPNGLGNLIVGYNELRQNQPGCEGSTDPSCTDRRTGSHNVVVGERHNFSRVGGLVVGRFNTISGDFAAVSGGEDNTASGDLAWVSGGSGNTASGVASVVSGGLGNTAMNNNTMVSGGELDTALLGSVYGGSHNTASGNNASVIGGFENTASGDGSTVSGGGAHNTASGFAASVIGGVENTASGLDASVIGGFGNTASGDRSTVSGGQNITQDTEFGWSAGSEADEVVVGNFRSP